MEFDTVEKKGENVLPHGANRPFQIH